MQWRFYWGKPLFGAEAPYYTYRDNASNARNGDEEVPDGKGFKPRSQPSRQEEILFDGVDLRDCSREYLHCQIGVIFQDFMRFEMTARENIAVGLIDRNCAQPSNA